MRITLDVTLAVTMLMTASPTTLRVRRYYDSPILVPYTSAIRYDRVHSVYRVLHALRSILDIRL